VTRALKEQRFNGIILKDIDPLNQGRYRVWIAELMHQIPNIKGIWCKNKVNNSGLHYAPILPGTDVGILFRENDFNSGAIVEINHDKSLDAIPHKAKMDDRDKVYNVMTTEGNQHVFVMTTGSKSVPGDSVHLYANGKSAKIVLNGDGFHIYSAGDLNVSAGADVNFSAGGNINFKSGGAFNIKGGGNINLDSGGAVNNKGSSINIDGGSVNLKGTVTAGMINGMISSAVTAGSLGGGGPGSPGAAGSAADNSGYGTKSPAEI